MGNSYSFVFALNVNRMTGAGHWMRCISLAEKLAKVGHKVAFYGRVEIEWLAKEHSRSVLLEKCQTNRKYDFLILDSYSKEFILEAIARISHRKSIQILDSNSPIVQIDGAIWVDPSPVPDVLFQKTHLIANSPILLVPNFLATLNLKPDPEKILITLGGQPHRELIQAVLSQIAAPEFKSYSFSVFTSPPYPHTPEDNVKLFPLSRALDSVAAESGTVISNAGTSLWKFIALRKPTGMIKMAKNQDANFDYATRNGLAVQIADFVRSKEINTLAMLTLVSDVKLRETLISNQSKYIANQNMPQLVENILNFGDS